MLEIRRNNQRHQLGFAGRRDDSFDVLLVVLILSTSYFTEVTITVVNAFVVTKPGR